MAMLEPMKGQVVYMGESGGGRWRGSESHVASDARHATLDSLVPKTQIQDPTCS